MTRDIERGVRSTESLISYSLYSILPTLIEMALVLGMRLWRKAGKKKPAATGPAQWEIITRKPLPAEPPPWEKETDKASPRSQTKPPSRD